MGNKPTGGSPSLLSPWAQTSNDYVNLKTWSQFTEMYSLSLDQYPTPFCVMAELIERWTMLGETEFTSELDEKERFKRLVEVVGGYPLLGGGYRPLDFPAHPLSKPALVLSVYLDTIPVGNDCSKWDSVRSHALLYDLELRGKDTQTYNTPLQNLTSFILYKIKAHEDIFDTRAKDETLTTHERRFLAVLHSHAHNRRSFWPPQLMEKQALAITIQKNIFDYKYHEFKLETIQTWINHWRYGLENQAKGVQHNFLIGPSVVLESIFVRMRSYILKEFGMGSMCIDGGGRIAFLSRKSKKEVADALEEFLHYSFINDGGRNKRMKHHPDGNIKHRHPFGSTISDAMRTYVEKSKQNDTPQWQRFAKKNKLKEHQEIPMQEAFNHFIGKGEMSRLLPSFSIEPKEPILETKKCSHVHVFHQNADWKTQGCLLCEGNELEKLNQSNCTEVCAMHWLIHEIARISKIRNASLGSQPGPERGFWNDGYGEISDVVALDGNSLGQIFLANYEWEMRAKVPKPSPRAKDPLENISMEEIKKIWLQFKDVNTSLRQERDPQEDAAWETLISKTKSIDKAKKKLEEFSQHLRLDAMLRLTRKSFNFNANWSLAFQNIIYAENSGLSPWIYAGDDIVLANRGGMNEEQVAHTLHEFHRKLNQYLGECDISFAGGWASKENDDTTYDALNRALENERVAKHTWKGQIKEEGTFTEMLGQKTHCGVCYEAGSQWLGSAKNANLFRYQGDENKPHSLMLRLSKSDLEGLAKNDSTTYQKV